MPNFVVPMTSTAFGSANDQSYGNFVFSSITFAGDGTIKVQSERQDGEFVEGTNYDLLTATNGISGSGDVKIDFSNASDFVTADEGSLYKVVAWSDLGETFNKENYQDINVSGSELAEHNFVHDFRNDGLYVGYVAVAVPEPSTYAAIFGTMAIVLALWRRRK